MTEEERVEFNNIYRPRCTLCDIDYDQCECSNEYKEGQLKLALGKLALKGGQR